MMHVQSMLESKFRTSLNEVPGSGAAGGVGGGLHVLFNAELVSGISFLIDRLDLNTLAQKADLIITGEGRIDEQTFHGKTIDGLIKLARKYDKPIIALCGKLECTAALCKNNGLTAAFSISPTVDTLEGAIRNTLPNLKENIQHIIQTILPFYERS
jgi:glycerate kinase